MKPLWMSLAVSLLFILFPFFSASAQIVQEDGTVIISPTPTPQQSVQYEMPYPGLLPDSPFYILKTLRDQVVGFLITDPAKKATFDLLQADKRFQAGIMLYEKDQDKKELAFSTLSKGHNYLDMAIDKALEARGKKIVSDVEGRIHFSLRKQEEVLIHLGRTKPGDEAFIGPALRRVAELQKQANELLQQDK